MSDRRERKLDGLVAKYEKKVEDGEARRKLDEVEADFQKDFPGEHLDCTVIVFGIRRAVSVSVLYAASTLLVIVLCIVLGLIYGIPAQVPIFVALIVAFIVLVLILARKAWKDAGYALCSEQFIGVYHLLRGKQAETTPSSVRRVEIGKRYLMVTCAHEDEDFRITRTDDRYLRFLKFLESCEVSAVDHLDFDKIDGYLEED